MKVVLSFLFILLGAELFAQNCNEANSLLSVKKRKAGRTEYVIFSLKNPVTATIKMSDAKRPFYQEASGAPIKISGCKFKKITFTSIGWQCKVQENFSSSTYLIRQVRIVEQFEGIINYVVGYRCNTKSIISYNYDDGDTKKYVVRLKY